MTGPTAQTQTHRPQSCGPFHPGVARHRLLALVRTRASRSAPIRPPALELLPHRPRPRDRIAMRKYR